MCSSSQAMCGPIILLPAAALFQSSFPPSRVSRRFGGVLALQPFAMLRLRGFGRRARLGMLSRRGCVRSLRAFPALLFFLLRRFLNTRELPQNLLALLPPFPPPPHLNA